jgi:starch synthase
MGMSDRATRNHRPLQVAFVATECFPFIKIGGLADVIGSLPAALTSLGVEVDLILPGFEPAGDSTGSPTLLKPIQVGGRQAEASVRVLEVPDSHIRAFVIEDGHFFPRKGLYVDPDSGSDYPDQAARWVFFQRAALALLERERPDIDVIHCHEHQTALIPIYIEHDCRQRGAFRDSATVLTIHNLGYQGIFPSDALPREALPEGILSPGGLLEFYGRCNLMKGGILTADALTVVSPTYAREIQTPAYGYGLDREIARRRSDLFGILNGIDTREWNPDTDTRIASRFSASSPQGKQADRDALLSEVGLATSAGPTLAMLARIDPHKGFDLLTSVLGQVLEEDIRFVLQGMGDRSIQSQLDGIAQAHPDKAAVRFVFDDGLAHRIIAGADVFLMPSRYEPCGLTQMYAMRYGTVPVVRRTGGLADTVREFDPQQSTGTGFLFDDYEPGAFRAAIDRAMSIWRSPHWATLMRNGMSADFSWTTSARRYMDIYRHALGKRRSEAGGTET